MLLRKEIVMKLISQKSKNEKYQIFPVGHVRRRDERTFLDILPRFIPALKELDTFSHVQVLWWFSQFDDARARDTLLIDKTPFVAPVLGVFACRSPMRPNPIGLTTAMILSIDEVKGVVEVASIDAFDGTPILDLKAYIPSCDRVQSVRVANWASDWPQWLPEHGLSLQN